MKRIIVLVLLMTSFMSMSQVETGKLLDDIIETHLLKHQDELDIVGKKQTIFYIICDDSLLANFLITNSKYSQIEIIPLSKMNSRFKSVGCKKFVSIEILSMDSESIKLRFGYLEKRKKNDIMAFGYHSTKTLFLDKNGRWNGSG